MKREFFSSLIKYLKSHLKLSGKCISMKLIHLTNDISVPLHNFICISSLVELKIPIDQTSFCFVFIIHLN